MPMSPRLLRPLASRGAFDPTVIADLLYWMDATSTDTLAQNSDGTTAVADGDPVGRWSDRFSTNNATQTTSNNRPIFRQSGINGRPALDFNAVSATSQNITQSSFSAHQQTTLVFVAEAVVTTSVRGLFGAIGSSRPQSLQMRSDLWQIGAASVVNFGIAVSSDPAIGVFTLDTATGSASLRINGGSEVSVTDAVLATGFMANMIIGSSAYSEFWRGYIGEVLRWTRILNVSEQDAVRQGLAAKWGIALA